MKKTKKDAPKKTVKKCAAPQYPAIDRTGPPIRTFDNLRQDTRVTPPPSFEFVPPKQDIRIMVPLPLVTPVHVDPYRYMRPVSFS